MKARDRLRAGSRLGKYRIERKLGDGGFAAVYRALDTLEGLRVALKVPHGSGSRADMEDEFRGEIRLAARLDHPNIMPLKNADVIDGRLVLVYPLGEKTLAERLRSRLSLKAAMEYAEQMLAAVAFAHEQRVIHCDIKPDNFILRDGELMLADFGIAKVSWRTVSASGAGTIGYCAPEQAMGKPSFRSDVFSLGLVLYRMFSGQLPEWPFDWPPPGHDRLRSRLHPDMIALVRRSLEVNPRKRFASATPMLAAFSRVKPVALRSVAKKRTTTRKNSAVPHWKQVQWRQFQRAFSRTLETSHQCSRCRGPVSEVMGCCPWCGKRRVRHDGETRFPTCCPRCYRGLKSDWQYCPWCFGPGFDVGTSRNFSDKRYIARCTNENCREKKLMAFMRYCPCCRRKALRNWKIKGVKDACSRCAWGVVSEFWDFCPWCAKKVVKQSR